MSGQERQRDRAEPTGPADGRPGAGEGEESGITHGLLKWADGRRRKNFLDDQDGRDGETGGREAKLSLSFGPG